MKFEIKDCKHGGYCLDIKSNGWLIWIGNIVLWKKDMKDISCCNQHEDRFDYHGLSKALYGNYFSHHKEFVIQMK